MTPTVLDIDIAAALHPRIAWELAEAEDLILAGAVQRTAPNGRRFTVSDHPHLLTVDLDELTCTCRIFYLGLASTIAGYTLCTHLIAALILDTTRQQDEPLPAA